MLIPIVGLSQTNKGTLIGRATDAAGAVLQGAQIQLTLNAGIYVSGKQGEFIITNLAPSAHEVKVSFVGFALFTNTVTINSGQTTRLDPVLQVASTAQEIEVTASAVHGDAEAINRIDTSGNILNMITNDQIMSLPNADVADALGHMLGVTLERDEGEGKYVQIRGTEPRLSNTTIDGVIAPSPESTVNQIKLDTIPTDLVESVEINKTLSANQDGDAIGGSVNLVTKTAGDRPTITAFGNGGHTHIIDGRHASQYGITAGKRYLADKKLGILGNFTYDYNGRGIDDIEPSPDPGYLTPMYDSIDLREHRYDRTRWGAAGSFDYKLSEGSLVFAKIFYSDFKDYGDKWVYTLNDQAFSPDCTPGDPSNPCGDKPKFSTSKPSPDFGIGLLTIGGNHLFTKSWFKWETAVSRARQLAAAGNPEATFKPATSALKNFAYANCYYDAAANPSQYRPEWNPACTAAGSPVFNPTQYQLTELDLTSGQTTQINLQGSASYGLNYHLRGHYSTLEFGAKVRNQHKVQFAYSPTYDNEPGGIMMCQFIGPIHNNNYYDGSYKMGPLTYY